ncbi:PilE-like protein [Elusimicrobium minutum Pei191]|uniref:PilE-like protein n=1 Tax=Elusimicrobium minutum (strain Pei191) TaxID=445932 RepID=B2KCD0_ELUMP|nr:prepilin-type N-terminal cleavage/methylation domain-containing protein [Elusimicrobium minutum]ACC98051.1 PilE-like protein [Elusimicrobium minutum Pei191]
MKKAFTLIELLVVVLIIGILAAIAVPQYNKAVLKSRATESMIIVNAIYGALERYKLATGQYPSTMSNFPSAAEINEYLDIEISLPKNTAIFYYPHSYFGINYNTASVRFTISKGLSENPNTTIQSHRPGTLSCWAYDTQNSFDLAGQNVCKSFCSSLSNEVAGTPTKACFIK